MDGVLMPPETYHAWLALYSGVAVVTALCAAHLDPENGVRYQNR